MKGLECVVLALVFECFEPGFEVGLSTGETAINELGQEVGHGGDGLWRSEPGAKPAEAITECGFGGLKGLGGEPQSHGGGRWSRE